MGFPQLEPTVLFFDNQSNIQLLKEFNGNHKRVIDLQYLPTKKMPANLLTNPVPASELREMLPQMMGLKENL